MVAVRCRPFNKRENELGSKRIVRMNGAKTTLVDPSGVAPEKDFTFDFSYDSFDSSAANFATNPKVYADLGVSVLNNAWGGYNCCLFAYGQTGSGKSYSMVGYGEDRGIVPQAMEEMFVRIAANKDKNIKYLVEASMMEIYNEKVRDLFNPDPSAGGIHGLKVRDNPASGPYVEGLSRTVLSSFKEFDHLLHEGTMARTVAATQMNATSSRAHTVFQIVFTTTTHDEETNKSSAKTSKINLVDLAGSERITKTGASGQQLKEGIGINKSLTALGNVIEKLALRTKKGSGKDVHVPYRDSVLTWLLKEGLGGNAKTIMIAAISPADDNYDESLSTLRYADRAKQIKNKAVVNEDENGRMIRELKKEIAALREALAKNGGVPAGAAAPAGMSDQEKEEYLALKEQMKASEEQMRQMNMTWEEKVKESEELAFRRAAALNANSREAEEKKKKLPHMVNLHKDKLMSECLSYFFVPGKTRLCTKAAEPPPSEDDIVLQGLQIKAEHAEAEYDPQSKELHLTPGEGARVFVNGKLIKERTALEHNDRLICGAHLVFRVIFPNHAADDGDSLFDWEFATKEMTTSTIEALNAPDPETLRQQQEAAEKMAKMQAEIEAERARAKEDQERKQREYEATLREIAKKKEDEIAATKRAIEQASAADSAKLSKKLAEREAELERERALAAKQHSERLEAMRREQAELESKLAAQREETKALHKKHEVEKRDRQLLEENLMHVIPMVNEANAICTELGQALRYSIKLEAKRSLDNDGFTEHTDVWIRVQNLEDDLEVMWDMDTLSEALYAMREIYNQYLRSGEIEVPERKEENPFHLQPSGPVMIGQARLYLQPCFFLLPIHESTAIIDYKGEHKGQLYVNLVPIPPRDEDTANLREEELFFEEEELTELKGEPLSMRLEIKKCMGLPQKLALNVFVSYKFYADSVESKTEPSLSDPDAVPTINPLLNYERTLLVDIIEDEFVEYIKSGILEFSVYGEHYIPPQEKDDDDDEDGAKAKGGAAKGKSGKRSSGKASKGSKGGDDDLASARLAKLEAVLKEITESVDPTLAADPTVLEKSPEVVAQSVKALKHKAGTLENEIVELKSPAKGRPPSQDLASAEAIEENARLKALLESLRATKGGEQAATLAAENAKIKAELESLRGKSSKKSAAGSGGMFPDAVGTTSAEEAAALRAEIEALKAASPSAGAAQATAAVLDENASLKAALESLKSKASPSAAELAELRQSAAAADSQLASLRKALAQKETEAEELRALKEAEAALNKELADKIAQGVSASATASVVGRNDAQVEQLKRDLESARNKVAAASTGGGAGGDAALAAEIEDLKRQLREKDKKSSACVIL